MSNDLHVGDRVAWNWGSSHVEGRVAEISEERMEKQIKGKTIVRNGTPDNPAVYVERSGAKNPTPVVKAASELHVLDTNEDPPSTEHVDTQRQRKLHGGKSGKGGGEEAEEVAGSKALEEEEEEEEEDEEEEDRE